VKTLAHHDKRGQPTQEARILNLLTASYPDWTPAPALARISLQYSARIHSLRRQGWEIANKIEHKDGAKHGYFRLAAPLTRPNPAPRAHSRQIDHHQSDSLFGDLSPTHKDLG
jgi:hypothetical protein